MLSFVRSFFCVSLTIILCRPDATGQKPSDAVNPVQIVIDAGIKKQIIDGIGVNANTRSWNGTELEPALALLLDSMHATIWRVLVESVEKWEEVNDNDDPFTFNWNYYNTLYETPKFRKVWEMVSYLNSRGITDRLMINFMGFAPPWMGVKIILPDKEDEFVEMIVSFFHYALKTKNLKIGLIAPTNETEHHRFSEGPHLDATQHARILRKIVDRMKQLGILGNIRFVAPDNADTGIAIRDFIPAMMKDSVVMSHLAHVSFHSYGGYYRGLKEFLKQSPYPDTTFWITEWNAWCNGCDDGILGEYNHDFASRSVRYLLELLKNGARAAIAWEGYDSYYEHHAPSPFSYWGMLAYVPENRTYVPRKNFFAIQHVSRYVMPGAHQVFHSSSGDSLTTVAFFDDASRRVTLVGVNEASTAAALEITLRGMPAVSRLEKIVTTADKNLYRSEDVTVSEQTFRTTVPAASIFTLTGIAAPRPALNPEPAGWYAGDIHVHRNCGDKQVVPLDTLASMMEENNLAVISLLADMGNGEVLPSSEDLPRVSGKDAAQSRPGRIIHWDAEWHWDATYSSFDHQALGGHLVLLGLQEARQIWDESPYKVLDWARKQNAIAGFCHFQYLNNTIQDTLNCCIPVEYPVEAALGTIDFISEDVLSSETKGHPSAEGAIQAYYKLLNCGFRPGLAAGTDFPCNNREPLGALLTYVNAGRAPLTYRAWIEGIRDGRTVVSRNGHREFIEMTINGSHGPGDEIRLGKKGKITANATWTATEELHGRVEFVVNGKVVAVRAGTAAPGSPVQLDASIEISESSWICARRMDQHGHMVHTAPVYITVKNKPVRASAGDAMYFISWIDHLLVKTSPGGAWNKFFKDDLDTVQRRYRNARSIYVKVFQEAQKSEKK